MGLRALFIPRDYTFSNLLSFSAYAYQTCPEPDSGVCNWEMTVGERVDYIVQPLVAFGTIVMIMIIIFSFITYLLSVNTSASTYGVLAGGPFGLTERGKLFQHILRFKSWPNIARNKKHKAV